MSNEEFDAFLESIGGLENGFYEQLRHYSGQYPRWHLPTYAVVEIFTANRARRFLQSPVTSYRSLY